LYVIIAVLLFLQDVVVYQKRIIVAITLVAALILSVVGFLGIAIVELLIVVVSTRRVSIAQVLPLML